MTNYEAIKKVMDTGDVELMAQFICGEEKIVEVIEDIYCTEVCEKHIGHYGCIVPDNEQPPCAELTPYDEAVQWLRAPFSRFE